MVKAGKSSSAGHRMEAPIQRTPPSVAGGGPNGKAYERIMSKFSSDGTANWRPLKSNWLCRLENELKQWLDKHTVRLEQHG
jgi:hypothetical protein